MKRALLSFVVIFIIFCSCSNPASPPINPASPPINQTSYLTGNWRATSTTTSTTDSNVFSVGGVTNAYFSIVDNGSSIAFTSFYINGQSYITWSSVSGVYSGNTFTGTFYGYYTNTYSQTVNVYLSFATVVNSAKTSGSGNFSQSLSVGGSSVSGQGTTVITKL